MRLNNTLLFTLIFIILSIPASGQIAATRQKIARLCTNQGKRIRRVPVFADQQ